jgi:hypothetical protein
MCIGGGGEIGSLIDMDFLNIKVWEGENKNRIIPVIIDFMRFYFLFMVHNNF